MPLRRRLLMQAALGSAAALLLRPTALLAREPGTARIVVNGALDYEDFLRLRRTWFFFANTDTADAGQVRLVGIQPLAMGEELSQYRLRFRSRRGVSLPSGRYHVTNWDGQPEFELYVEAGRVRRGLQSLYADFAQLAAPVGTPS